MKKLSAIIPCRHQAKFLPGLVTDLKRELGQEIEIIVVEDASNEDSVYEVALPAEVRILRSETRLGPSGARNWGAKCATSDLLYFIDADDRPAAGALKEALHFLKYHPTAEGVMGSLAGFIDDKGVQIYPENAKLLLEPFPFSELTFDYLKRGGRFFPNVGRFLFKKKTFWEVGGFSLEWERGEDWDFILSWLKKNPLATISTPMNYYRVHGNNGTARLRDGFLEAHPKSLAAGKLVRMSHGLEVHSESRF